MHDAANARHDIAVVHFNWHRRMNGNKNQSICSRQAEGVVRNALANLSRIRDFESTLDGVVAVGFIS